MPQSRSAKKRVRQNEKARQRNKSVKSTMRSQVKRVEQAIDAGDPASAKKEFPLAVKQLDKAAKRNIIHPNQAARRKSRLQRAVNDIES